jgi:hypothetical protein
MGGFFDLLLVWGDGRKEVLRRENMVGKREWRSKGVKKTRANYLFEVLLEDIRVSRLNDAHAADTEEFSAG